MIQCTTKRTAEMALRIKAVHRWCVTGTPLQKGLEGLFPVLFLIEVALCRFKIKCYYIYSIFIMSCLF